MNQWYLAVQVAVAAAAFVLAGTTRTRGAGFSFALWGICGTLALGSIASAAQGLHPPVDLLLIGEIALGALAVVLDVRTPRRRRA